MYSLGILKIVVFSAVFICLPMSACAGSLLEATSSLSFTVEELNDSEIMSGLISQSVAVDDAREEELLDIRLTIPKHTIVQGEDLVSTIVLDGFGEKSALVNLGFSIKNERGRVLHRSEREVGVQTSAVVQESLHTASLPPGKYVVRLTSKYGEGVVDHFVTDLRVDEAPLQILGIRADYIVYICSLIIVVFGALFGIKRYTRGDRIVQTHEK